MAVYEDDETRLARERAEKKASHQGKCAGYKCGCHAAVLSTKKVTGHGTFAYEYCECGHTMLTHARVTETQAAQPAEAAG